MTSPRALLRELMSRAASADSLDAVYRSALRCVQEGIGVERASLLLFDTTGKMRFVAWSGISDEYRRAVDGHSPWSPSETDAVSLLVSDVERDPSTAAFVPVMRQEGIRAVAFIPLQFGANLLGKFMLYYREPHVFSGAEIATAEQIADYVVFALEHHRIALALEEQLVSERQLRQHAQAEAAQRQESESRLHVALAAGQMGAWEWNGTTGLMHWSEELERMHGLEPHSFGGTAEEVLQFVHPLDADRFAEMLATLGKSPQRDYQLDFRVVRRDGAVRWIAARGRMLLDSEGRPSRMVGVSTDITEARQLAEAASEADRRKDDFLATLAHELRNPLAAVRTAAAVIRKAQGDPGTVVEYCTIMERQLRHLTRLVDDLLDVADITRRGLPMAQVRVEFSAVVRAALEQGLPLVEEAGHELSVTLPAGPVMLHADPERVVQILTNLLSNAVKYTPRGGRIALTAECEADELRLSVKDCGLGIPIDQLDSVFEMFSQLDRSLETGNRGLGIGLALAKALVVMHGGRIKVYSEGLGTGSEFTIWLPLAATFDAAQPAMTREPSQGPNVPTGCRVLMVDDNQDVARSTGRLLRLMGHDVRVALNGAEAMEIADDFHPDVVLLDIAMPKVNGYEVARTLRSTWGRQMTLVAVTGLGQETDQRRSAEAGFDRHMTKPVDPLVLEAFLDSIARPQTAATRAPAG